MSFKNIDNKISLLLRLLGDSDKFIRERITKEFVEVGEDSLPFLEIAARDENPEIRAQAKEILALFAPQKLREKFRRLSSKISEDLQIALEEGVLLIAEYGYPDLDVDALRSALDHMARELGARLLPSDNPLQIVEKMTAYLFREKGFSGNKTSYFDADNSYLNKVVLRGTGIPITLSILCILVGNRLNLPISGVGMPAHFIARYDSPEGGIYFDPFDKGRILSKTDCMNIVKQFGFDFEERFLDKTDNRAILLRMIHNLVTAYNMADQLERSKQLTEYAHILMNLPENRDQIKSI